MQNSSPAPCAAETIDKPTALYQAIKSQEFITSRLRALRDRISPVLQDVEADTMKTPRGDISLYELLCEGPHVIAVQRDTQRDLIDAIEQALFDN